MTTMFETLGNRCALCALEPRVEMVAERKTYIEPNEGKGLSWQETFALGWFLGRYTTSEAVNYCTAHRVCIEELRKQLAKVGIVSLHDVSLLDEPPHP